MKDPTKTELEASASALLDAIVRAEIELRAIETSCRSLEDAIELGQEALASAPATQAEGETEWEAARVAAPVAAEVQATVAVEPPPVAEKLPEMAPAPVGAIAAVAREPEPEVEEPAPVSRSLEEQAAALRAAMAKPGASVSAPPTPPSIAPKEVAADSNGRNGSAGSDASAVEDASGLERRPFGPKRTTPLKSRLAGTTEGVSPAEGETFSERSAELEQLLRHRDD